MQTRKRKSPSKGSESSHKSAGIRRRPNSGPGPSFDDVISHYGIAERIAFFLLPLDPAGSPRDLSSLSKCASCFHPVLKPFLFRSINLRRFNLPIGKKQAPLKDRLREVLYPYFEEWRPDTYALVKHLMFPFWVSPELGFCLDLASHLPNLESLALPHKTGPLKAASKRPSFHVPIDADVWPDLRALDCGDWDSRLDAIVASPSLRTLHLTSLGLFNYAAGHNVDRESIPERWRAQISTSASDIVISGPVSPFSSAVFATFKWPKFAPKAKNVVFKAVSTSMPLHNRDGSNALLALLGKSDTAQTLCLLLPGVARSHVKPHNSHTIFGAMTLPIDLAKNVLQKLMANNGCPALTRFTFAVQPLRIRGNVDDRLKAADLRTAIPRGLASGLSETRPVDWQLRNFWFWHVCTAKKEGAEWEYTEEDMVVWKKDKDYPFVL